MTDRSKTQCIAVVTGATASRIGVTDVAADVALKTYVEFEF